MQQCRAECHSIPTAQQTRARRAWGTGVEDRELIQWILGLKSALLSHAIRYQQNPNSTEGWTCGSYSPKPCLHPIHRKSHFSWIIIFLPDVTPIASIWSSWEHGVRAVQKQSIKQNWRCRCPPLGTECPTCQQVPSSSCTEESALPLNHEGLLWHTSEDTAQFFMPIQNKHKTLVHQNSRTLQLF